jgi:hypothetical protein
VSSTGSAKGATPVKAKRQLDAVRLDDLNLSSEWRAWLLARVNEEGGLAGALRSVIGEAAMASVFRMQYDKEQELRRGLLAAGRTHAEVRRLVVRWRRGERIEDVTIGPPAAARILHPGVLSRVPQIRRVRTTGERQRKQARSPRRSGGKS